MIATVFAKAMEVPWAVQKNVGYGVGPKKMTEHFCYLGAHRNHVNLGFNHGANLADPDELLEGTGKLFRHVKLRSMADLKQPALKRLLKAAVSERQAALKAGS